MEWLGEIARLSLPVAAVAERGPGPTTPAKEAAAAGDNGYSIGERLLKLSVGTRFKKMWEQLAQTLDRSLPTESPTRPVR